MYEAEEAATVTEVLLEWASGAPDYIDVETSAHTSVNVYKLYELVEAAAVNDQHNEEAMEYEVFPEGDIVNPKDMEVYASAPPSANIGEMMNP